MASEIHIPHPQHGLYTHQEAWSIAQQQAAFKEPRLTEVLRKRRSLDGQASPRQQHGRRPMDRACSDQVSLTSILFPQLHTLLYIL